MSSGQVTLEKLSPYVNGEDLYINLLKFMAA